VLLRLPRQLKREPMPFGEVLKQLEQLVLRHRREHERERRVCQRLGIPRTPPGYEVVGTREPVPDRRLFVVEVHEFARQRCLRWRGRKPDLTDAFPWDALRLPGDVVQRGYVRPVGSISNMGLPALRRK
jgi:hypothetical protein